MMWGSNGWSWWGWALMSLSMVAFWGLVVWGIVALFRRPADRWPGDGRSERPDPERILGERFARGEIDEEEYHRRLQTLRSANGQLADLSR